LIDNDFELAFSVDALLQRETQRYETEFDAGHYLSDRPPKRGRCCEGETV
jgi:hypothetical protein